MSNRSLVAAGALLLSASIFSAVTSAASSNLNVSVTVAVNCTMTAGTLAFGSYDPVGANAAAALDASGTFTVACTKGAAGVTIDLGQGGNYSSGRRMTFSSSYLSYQLYSDSNRSAIWGSTSGGSAINVSPPASSAPVTYTVYGRIPPGQDIAAGNYSDTVVMTVNF